MLNQPMAATDQTARIYEDFEPATTWGREPGHDTLILQLKDFRIDQLKVQITQAQNLRISGERPLGNNKWKRFRVEMPIPTNYDTNQISAKFENHKLYIKLIKLIAPSEPEPEPEPESPVADDRQVVDSTPQKPASATDSVQAQMLGQEQATQRLPSKTGTGAVERQRSGGDNVNGAPVATSMEKTTSRKASGAANAAAAADDDQKAPAMQEKQQSIKKEKSGSASVDAEYAKTVSRKSSDKKEEGLTDDQTMKENRSGIGGSAAGEEASDMEKFEDDEACNKGENKSRMVVKRLKQAVGVLVMELKNSRLLQNLAVAALFLLVSLLYARNAIRSITEKSNDSN